MRRIAMISLSKQLIITLLIVLNVYVLGFFIPMCISSAVTFDVVIGIASFITLIMIDYNVIDVWFKRKNK